MYNSKCLQASTVISVLIIRGQLKDDPIMNLVQIQTNCDVENSHFFSIHTHIHMVYLLCTISQ
uniref:Uncharacterized protein n=1 Tax=Arundo donax TaxID=35708 RepID=A0A0A9F272_ARUDO